LSWLLFFIFKNPNKLKIKFKFGLQWLDGYPLCRKCNSQLTKYVNAIGKNQFFGTPYFKCEECEHKNHIKTRNGKYPTEEEMDKILGR